MVDRELVLDADVAPALVAEALGLLGERRVAADDRAWSSSMRRHHQRQCTAQRIASTGSPETLQRIAHTGSSVAQRQGKIPAQGRQGRQVRHGEGRGSHAAAQAGHNQRVQTSSSSAPLRDEMRAVVGECTHTSPPWSCRAWAWLAAGESLGAPTTCRFQTLVEWSVSSATSGSCAISEPEPEPREPGV